MAEEKGSFLVKLEELERRYSEIEKQISEPAIGRDSARLIALSKEQARLWRRKSSASLKKKKPPCLRESKIH